MSDEQLDVFGWLADHTGCGTIRLKQPLTALAEERGLTTDFSERMSTKDRPLPKTFVGQRVCKDAPSSLWFGVGIRKDRPRMVFEVDDDLWNIDPTNARAFEWFTKGIAQDDGTVHNVVTNLRRNIAVADYVTTTTEPLAELLSNYNDNVHIIPNYIPRWVTEWDRPKRDTLTVGWGGSGTHSMDWAAEGPQIKRWLTRNSKIPFRLIGAGDGRSVGLPQDQVSAVGWIDSVETYWKTIDYDIGIIPLKHHVFNQSKSHLKFLENSALGIPTIASDAGPYSRSIVHGETGYLVKRDHEWAKYLNILVNDEAARTEIAANAKAWAMTQILEDHLDEYTKVYCD